MNLIVINDMNIVKCNDSLWSLFKLVSTLDYNLDLIRFDQNLRLRKNKD